MRSYRGRAVISALPLKSLIQRSALVLFVGVALTAMILSRVEVRIVDDFRGVVNDAAAPILDFFSHPARSVATFVEDFDELLVVLEDNKRLKMQNAQLIKWKAVAEDVLRENEKFRQRLQIVPDPESRYITARVIADSGGPFVRTVLVNVGTSNNVQKGQAAISGEGLIGRVVSTGSRSARILLLTDLNSRIPVVVETTRDKAILAGNNTLYPKLEFVSADARINVGDRIVTSGQGGIFPPGLPVGLVTSVDDEVSFVQIYADLDRLEFVTILDYILSGLLPDTIRAGRIGNIK